MDAGEVWLGPKIPFAIKGREAEPGDGRRHVAEYHEWMLKLYGRFDPETPPPE